MGDWHTAPRWRKRLEGFLCYQLAAFISLFKPEAADRAMYSTLREQFTTVEESEPHQGRGGGE